MKYALPIVLLLFLAAGCGTRQPGAADTLFRPETLPAQYLTLNLTRDTVIRLAGGTLLTVPAGALKTAATTIRLEIREVLSLAQMIRGGLYTRSQQGLLSSGGMIYVGLAPGEQATLQKPLQAKIPARFASADMQLWRGEVADDGLTWTDPQPLTTELSDPLAQGRALFEMCSSCHNTQRDATGPILYHTLDRWGSKADLYAFVRNPSRLIADGHPYANCVFEQWYKTQMTAFPNLTDRELDLLFAYADHETAKRLGADTARLLRYSRDSCRKLEAVLNALETQRAAAHMPMLELDVQPPPGYVSGDTGTGTKVVIDIPPAEYYTIDIQALGWYNVDVLLAAQRGAQPSRLVARLQDLPDVNLRVLLVIPSQKVIAPGGKLGDGSGYGFLETDGTLPLPQGVQAYLLAVGERRDRAGLYFGQTPFITARDQTLTVVAHPTDSVALAAAIQALSGDGVRATVRRDTAAEKVRVLTAEIDALRSEFEGHCRCYQVRADAAVQEQD